MRMQCQRVMDEEERTEEIARMLSGDDYNIMKMQKNYYKFQTQLNRKMIHEQKVDINDKIFI